MEADEHPQLRMWRDRLDAELARQAAHAARRAVREAEREDWYAAWHQYKKHNTMEFDGAVRPRWWNFLAGSSTSCVFTLPDVQTSKSVTPLKVIIPSEAREPDLKFLTTD